jgi:predicted glycosyltransferase
VKKIFIYAHDAYGIGNTRRMTAVACHLVRALPDANVLLASGSPVLQGFRLPDRVDYIKLPSVARTEREQYETRYLTTEIADTIRLRSALLRAAVTDFAPDVVLVDKKPFGIMGELKAALEWLKSRRPWTRTVLVLRDILDEPARTVPQLIASDFERDVNLHFDRVAILGTPGIFDAAREYAWSEATASKAVYCGYLETPAGRQSPQQVRAECSARAGEPLVVVSAGGGEDGAGILTATLEALAILGAERRATPPVRALVVTGPHAPAAIVSQLRDRAQHIGGVTVREFTDDMASYVEAADATVSMCGYNTACDILSRGRGAVVVPRVHPVREQWIRAQRLAQQGLVRVIHPDRATPAALASAIAQALEQPRRGRAPVDLRGLPRLTECLEQLIGLGRTPAASPHVPVRALAGLLASPVQPRYAARGTR